MILRAKRIALDTELAGVTLKAGEMLILPTPLAGTDDRENPDPLRIDFQRVERHHATFGAGSHRCPGAPLARLEMQITFEEWLRRIPEFGVAPGVEVRFKGGETASVGDIPLVWDPATTMSV